MADRPRSESFRRIKLLFISSLIITVIFTVISLIIALKTGHEQLDRAAAAETDHDVKQMYSTIRPILTGLIIFIIIIEWIILTIGITGALIEHYIMSLIFAIIQAIGLICSLFQIGPVLLELKIIWVLIHIISTSLSAVFVYCLRCEMLRPRFNQK
jgi:hypothetical protein